MLNGALRNQATDVLHKLGFFIRDLHNELHQLQRSAPFRLSVIIYRGQGLNRNDFKRIQSTPNGIISFHNFLSTSRSENIARLRAKSTTDSHELVGIFFHMTVSPSIGDIIFVSIDNQSDFGFDEAEVLFSINTIFRIGQIEPLGPNLDRIRLTLIRNDDQEIQQLTQYLREEISVHDDSLSRFGQFDTTYARMDESQRNLSKQTGQRYCQLTYRRYGSVLPSIWLYSLSLEWFGH
ncbi:unnamed protein product [Rotaria sp. Silwood2]|nr:unnamed protein product [Rotaria sp. Silwood2]